MASEDDMADPGALTRMAGTASEAGSPGTDSAPLESGIPGDRIGPYRLLRLLGEGGMGRVYLAREENLGREVALKVVRGTAPGLARRLRREIETLASLEHPGIARLYAAGEVRIHGADVPWLAMEYIRGTDLLTHVRREHPDFPARLRLLVEVARAVAHAHAHGVIHRDLKPGNVLVDERGQVKVLDFGIAHREDATDETLTLAGQLLGTLPYMSPEQLGAGDAGADVRSDVYALGVIAYQLIGGVLPYPELAGSTLFEALDIVRRGLPPPLAQLASSARGDLNTVVMKALASESSRRYASASDFADDLERVLAQRPILARPPTLAYRGMRFIQRHRALSLAAAVVFAVLVTATTISLRFAFSEQAAHAQAERRAAEAAAVSGFLQHMLASANPELNAGIPPSLATLVSQAEMDLDRLGAQPSVQRVLAATLASTRRALGDYPAALALSDRALARADDATPAQRRTLLRERATILTELARYDEARTILAEARAAWPEAPLAARLDLDREAVRIDMDEGDVERAEQALRSLLARIDELEPAVLAADKELEATATTARNMLSELLRDSGHLEEAEALVRAVLVARTSRLGERAPATLASRHNLALVLASRDELEAAETEARATLALQREVLGEEHSATLTSWQTLANILIGRNELVEAEEAARRSMTGFERAAGEDHVQTLAAMNSLAYILEERQEVAAAEAVYRRIIALQERSGSRHPTTFAARNNLGMLLMEAERTAEAEAEFARLVDDSEAALGAEHLMTAIFRSNRGLCLGRAGRLTEARRELEAARGVMLDLVGPAHVRTRAATERLADVEERLGAHARAAALRAEAEPSDS